MNNTAIWLGIVGLLLSAVTIFAIFYGPISALKMQRKLDEEREARNRKLWVFKTLMSFRATSLSPQFVQALNLIDVEFDRNNEKEKAVRNAWKVLLDHFGDLSGPNMPANANDKSVSLTTNLLMAMGECLGYDFDEVHVKKGAYYPRGLGNVEEEQHAMRKRLLELLDGSGTRKLPIAMFEQKFPDIKVQSNNGAVDDAG